MRQSVPVGRTSVQFIHSGNQFPLTQSINQIPITQPISQVPVSQAVQVVQNHPLGASGIRESRVNLGAGVQIGQTVVQNTQFQTVRPSTVFVKQL